MSQIIYLINKNNIRKIVYFISSLLIFLFLLVVGFAVANNKPLWNDEIYSQVSSVESLSYIQIIRGEVGEGNPCPLFYLFQKIICFLSDYSSPKEWSNGTDFWDFSRPVDQIVLRINPVVCTSLSIVAIFYFFSRFYNIWLGLYSLFISISTNMIWSYWAEARPYALWMFLTTLQMLLCLYVINQKRITNKVIVVFSLIHVILSLTVTISIIQIIVVSIFLWFFDRYSNQGIISRNEKPRVPDRRNKGSMDNFRNINFKKWCVFLICIPVTFCFYYYSQAPKYTFWLEFSLDQYIREPISRDRIYLIYVFMLFVILYWSQQKYKFPRLYNNKIIIEAVPVLILSVLMIGGSCLLYYILKFTESAQEGQFPVHVRYFINLVPVGILFTTVFTYNLLKTFRNNLGMLLINIIGIGFLIIPRFLKNLPDIIKHISG